MVLIAFSTAERYPDVEKMGISDGKQSGGWRQEQGGSVGAELDFDASCRRVGS